MQCAHPRSSSTCALCSLGTLGQNWDWKGEVWFVCQSISTSLKVKVHCSSGVRVWLSRVPGQLSKFASFAHHRLQKFSQAFFGLAQGHNKKFFIWVNGIDKQHIYITSRICPACTLSVLVGQVLCPFRLHPSSPSHPVRWSQSPGPK